jgi:hypothetical protein
LGDLEECKQLQLKQQLQSDASQDYLLNDGNIGGTFCIDKDELQTPDSGIEQRDETSGLLVSMNHFCESPNLRKAGSARD